MENRIVLDSVVRAVQDVLPALTSLRVTHYDAGLLLRVDHGGIALTPLDVRL